MRATRPATLNHAGRKFCKKWEELRGYTHTLIPSTEKNKKTKNKTNSDSLCQYITDKNRNLEKKSFLLK